MEDVSLFFEAVLPGHNGRLGAKPGGRIMIRDKTGFISVLPFIKKKIKSLRKLW